MGIWEQLCHFSMFSNSISTSLRTVVKDGFELPSFVTMADFKMASGQKNSVSFCRLLLSPDN
jgi:hypothetical protein